VAEKCWSASTDEGCDGPGATVNASAGLRIPDVRRGLTYQCRGRGGKTGDRLALPPVEAALNLQGQYVPASTVLNGLTDVPFSISRPLNPVKQYAVVKPGNLCSKLLHNCPVRPGGGGQCLARAGGHFK